MTMETASPSNYSSVTAKQAAAAARPALAPLSADAQKLIIGGTYQHYSGNQYTIIGIARHTETLEEQVVYQRLENGGTYDQVGNLWVRPLKMFVESVTINDQQVPRFKLITSQTK